jgi:uncharacterized RDD family membrane protein YckC
MTEGTVAAPQAAGESFDSPAGFWVRAGAAFIDGLVLLAALVAAAVLIVLVVHDEGGRRRLIQLASIALGGAYYTALTGLTGQTVGKMAAGIRVVSKEGEPIGFGRALGRWAAYSLSSLPLGLGFLAAGVNAQRRGLHDYVAGTRVIYLPNVGQGRKAMLAGLGAFFMIASSVYAALSTVGEMAGPAGTEQERLLKEGAAVGTLKSLRTVSAMYRADMGKDPASLEALKELKDFTAIPSLELPEHKASNAVETYQGAVVNGAVEPGKLKDTGHWAYDPATGTVFIDCTHVDSEKNGWFKY